jgi:hypothetical protein
VAYAEAVAQLPLGPEAFLKGGLGNVSDRVLAP